MDQYSSLQRAYYGYLGRALSFTYFTRYRKFLGAALSSWLLTIPFGLALVALVLRMGWSMVALFLMIWAFLRFSYWRARKMGYNKFVPDHQNRTPERLDPQLATGTTLAARASGQFAISGQQQSVLLQPCDYWHVPLGDHVIMVKQGEERFLYQFFNPRTLQYVQKGWLLFGDNPLETLAITFLETWGPDHNNNALQYFVGGGNMDMVKLKPRTIYLSFDESEALRCAWATMLTAARQARVEAGAATPPQ